MAVCLGSLASMVAGCQEAKEPTITLTQAQWAEVKQNILTQPPAKMDFTVGANYGDRIELLGFDIAPKSPKPGQDVTLTWYWKAKKDMKVNWQVFIHMDSAGPPPTRQGLDHHPVRDLYQTTRWEAGQIVKDVQKVKLRGDYPGGKATFWIGLWNPASSKRLPLVNVKDVKHDNDNRVNAGEITIDAPKRAAKKDNKRTKPKIYLARALDKDAAASITIDGKLDDKAWATASRSPRFGGTRGGPGSPGTSWFKILYDDTHLYIGAWGEDKDVWGDLTERDSATWTQEVFEIFIDPEGDQKDYLELQVTPRNTVFDARFPVKLGRGRGSRDEQINTAKAWNSTMTSAVHVDGTLNDPSDEDKAWSIELKIPFTDIPKQTGAPKPGTSWKMNLYRFDAPRKDGKPTGQVAWSWSPSHGFFHNIQHFGMVRFMGAKGPIEVKPLTPNTKAAPDEAAGGADKPAPEAKSPKPKPKPKGDEVAPDTPPE